MKLEELKKMIKEEFDAFVGEAEDDVNSPVTDTTQEDISRNVNVVVGPSVFGNKTNI